MRPGRPVYLPDLYPSLFEPTSHTHNASIGRTVPWSQSLSFTGHDASQSAQEEGSFDPVPDSEREMLTALTTGRTGDVLRSENEKQLPLPGSLSTHNSVP
jgi:hypothetical protein